MWYYTPKFGQQCRLKNLFCIAGILEGLLWCEFSSCFRQCLDLTNSNFALVAVRPAGSQEVWREDDCL